MSVSIPAPSTNAPLRIAVRSMALPLLALIVLLVSVPMLTARPANLTSDESLYLAEAYNIAHGEGAIYPSGDAVVHRAPLFPATLAPFVRIAGPDAAYAVTKAIVVVNALLVMLLAYRMGGALAGAIAGVTAAGAAYLNGLGTTLYLDPFQCAFMLLALLALHEASTTRRARWLAVSGLLVGVAFLAKESAVQWAPLGMLAWLMVPSLRAIVGARGALAFTLAFGAAVAPWYAWVWAQNGELFMLGTPAPLSMLLLGGAAFAIAAFSVGISAWPAASPSTRRLTVQLAPYAATAIVAFWAAFMLYGLTRYSGWGYNNDYLTNVRQYMTEIAPQAQPYLLLVLAWAWVGWAAFRRDDAARLLAAAALLFLPFALFIANRDLQLRDALPLVYVSYVALGLAAAWGVRALTRTLAQPAAEPMLLGALVMLATIFLFQQGSSFRDANDRTASAGVGSASWNSEFVRENAAWMSDNLPSGSRILSSRLYFSSLHVNTGGEFRIHQMPTVRVDIDPAADDLLTPASNLFRWGERDVRPYRSGDDWMYLRQYPGKEYWIALSQQELMEYIGTREMDYVVLTGDDGTFSSLAYASYFSAHPAFSLIYHERRSQDEQFFIYQIDRAKLGTMDYPMTTSPASFDALLRATGLTPAVIESRLGVPMRVTDAEIGLSSREELTALVASSR